MTSSLAQAAAAHDQQDYDWWAIQVVVREAKPMNLARHEQVIAAKLMREKGYLPADIGAILGLSSEAVIKILGRNKKWPIPREDIPVLVGAEVPKTGPFMSRAEVRRVIGR